MNASIEVTIEDEISQVKKMGPHLVILGAGASRAAFPNGDASGSSIPLMNDVVDIVAIRSILEENGIEWRGGNFEEIYGNLAIDESKQEVCEALNSVIYEYFSSLSLPDTPTLYDHLVLSLREKDVIATFNWDPFLVLACRRNMDIIKSPPPILFLHGNVATGYCNVDKVHGTRGGTCRCGQPYFPTQLLYPIKNKDYTTDPEIKEQWDYLASVLQNAPFVTIFGYSAPASDSAAIDLFSRAWGNPRDREFEQIEIIDIKDNQSLRRTWRRFIHTHHYDTHCDFYDSWIANHPRRTIEAYFNQYIGAKFIEPHPIPKDALFSDLWGWFEPLIEAEK